MKFLSKVVTSFVSLKMPYQLNGMNQWLASLKCTCCNDIQTTLSDLLTIHTTATCKRHCLLKLYLLHRKILYLRYIYIHLS